MKQFFVFKTKHPGALWSQNDETETYIFSTVLSDCWLVPVTVSDKHSVENSPEQMLTTSMFGAFRDNTENDAPYIPHLTMAEYS